MARRAALALVLSAFAAACGDDGKVGSSGPPRGDAPAGNPSPTPPASTPAPIPPISSTIPTIPTVPTGWAGTHAGDWAAWEVRMAGTDAVTRLTWRATRVDAGRITFSIESKTTARDGRAIASASSEEVHDAAADPAADPAPVAASKSADVTVSGAKIPTWVHVRPNPAGEVTIWTSGAVPFSGVVRASGGGVDQTLVGFGRGR